MLPQSNQLQGYFDLDHLIMILSVLRNLHFPTTSDLVFAATYYFSVPIGEFVAQLCHKYTAEHAWSISQMACHY